MMLTVALGPGPNAEDVVGLFTIIAMVLPLPGLALVVFGHLCVRRHRVALLIVGYTLLSFGAGLSWLALTLIAK